MSKFKLAALALAAAGLLSAQAQAGEAQVQSLQAMPVAAFSQSDIQGMFEQAGQPMELAALSGQEMQETEGAFLPWVIRGGVMGTIGGIGNAANSFNNGQRGWAVVRAGGIGFAVGATGGVASRWLGNRRW